MKGKLSHEIVAPARNTSSNEVLKVSSAQIQSFVRYRMKRFGWTWDEVAEKAVEAYGSLERAVWMLNMEDAAAMEAYKKANPDGAQRNVIGGKPKPREQVISSRLGPNLSIRVWGGDLASIQYYSFDFVNDQGQHIRTPEGIEMFTMPSATSLSFRVMSIEASTSSTSRRQSDAEVLHDAGGLPGYMNLINQGSVEDKYDPTWGTYIVQQGTALRIVQPGHEDRFLTIPTRAMNPANILVLEPWRPAQQ